MTFQYQDEDSGVQTRQSLLCIEKMLRLDTFLDIISWDYDNIAAAVLRHAEFPEVRQS